MKLTDTLDMVGVQLCASWARTRQKNGSQLQEKVSLIAGSWRTGKFMPLISRPFSANCYIFNKIWYKCHTVNLREGDYNAVNSSVKKWLYSDLLIKPEVCVLYRDHKEGGLGMNNVRNKSRACFTRTFLELAANPAYNQSLFLSSLFRYYVLKDAIPPPRLPPYFSQKHWNLAILLRL